ncbi:MAG: hypothetical protein HFP78_07070 [Methylococcales symbiont of Hymedesmia sp. n. MRB-2018]|nr:MAG: hypothetical protein HFP78_07070 [Methylococcales symbiont of Hymedesmia sp. n. MRB-2018]
MTEKINAFPDTVELNGADCFLLQLDKLMWSSNKRRNVCTFALTLDRCMELDTLTGILSTNPAYQWVCGLRLKKGFPFSLPKWEFNNTVSLAKIQQHKVASLREIPDVLLATDINLKNQSAFKVDLVQLASSKHSILIFTWHHVLMDARGGESFIRYLGSMQALEPSHWIAEKPHRLPLKERADIAQAMKQFLYDTSGLPLLSLYKKSSQKPLLRYRTLFFSEQQSQKINQQAVAQGAGFLPSAFYLASTAYAVARIQQQRTPALEDMLVPIPLDRRLRGTQTPIIGNQVSFLFYRLPKQLLLNTEECTVELIKQMKQLMRLDNPTHYIIMLDFLRRIPGLFYRMLLKAPTKGLMASFFYSDTGDLLADCKQLFGSSIKQAIHYPPNLYPPGMTFVYSRHQNCLQLTFTYIESVINEQEVEQLFSEISAALLGSSRPGNDKI